MLAASAGLHTELLVGVSVTTGVVNVSAIVKSMMAEQLSAVVTFKVYGIPPPTTLLATCPLTPDKLVLTKLAGNVFCPLNHSYFKPTPEGF